MPELSCKAANVGPIRVDMRRRRVPLPVRILMMSPVNRRPEDRRALDADGSQNDEHGPDSRRGLECAMRDEPMIPPFDAEGTRGIETNEQGHIEFAKADLERDEDCGDDPQGRNADYSKGDASFNLPEG